MKQVAEKPPNESGDEIVEMSAARRSSTSRKIKRQRLSVDYNDEKLNHSRNWNAEIATVAPKTREDIVLEELSDESPDDLVSGSSFKPDSMKVEGRPVCRNVPINQDDFFLIRRRMHADVAGEDLTSKLSDELILIIFRWLPKKSLVQCAHVCKRWREIAYDESLWTRMDLSSRVLIPGSLGHVLQRGVIALRLASADVREPVFDPSLSFIEDGVFCKLQYLDLTMTVISAADLTTLLKTTKNLVKLSLEHCTLTEESCSAIALNTELEVLNLSMCYGITETGVKSILTGCRRLLELNLAWTCLNPAALEVLSAAAPRSLKRLNISGCRKILSDEHVQQLVGCCPHLLELDLSDCTNLTSRSVNSMAPLYNLEHVAFSRCYNITSSSYLFLSTLKSLLYLDVLGLFADQSLTRLQQNLPNISINKFMFSSIARPTVGVRRTSIWGLKVRL